DRQSDSVQRDGGMLADRAELTQRFVGNDRNAVAKRGHGIRRDLDDLGERQHRFDESRVTPFVIDADANHRTVALKPSTPPSSGSGSPPWTITSMPSRPQPRQPLSR